MDFLTPICRNALFCNKRSAEQQFPQQSSQEATWNINLQNYNFKLSLDKSGDTVNTAPCAICFFLNVYFSCIFVTVNAYRFLIKTGVDIAVDYFLNIFVKWFSGLERHKEGIFLGMTKRKYCAPRFFSKGDGFSPPFLQDRVFMGNYLP